MRQCIRCREIRYWFQLFWKDAGLYVQTYDVCRKCANELKEQAVDDYWEENFKG